jgi:hypothetical protein
VEGPGVTRFRFGLSVGGEQFPPTGGLQQSRPAQWAGDPHRPDCGGQLLGIPGALLAIPVADIIRIVVTELLAYRRERPQANKKPAVSSQSP